MTWGINFGGWTMPEEIDLSAWQTPTTTTTYDPTEPVVTGDVTVDIFGDSSLSSSFDSIDTTGGFGAFGSDIVFSDEEVQSIIDGTWESSDIVREDIRPEYVQKEATSWAERQRQLQWYLDNDYQPETGFSLTTAHSDRLKFQLSDAGRQLWEAEQVATPEQQIDIKNAYVRGGVEWGGSDFIKYGIPVAMALGTIMSAGALATTLGVSTATASGIVSAATTIGQGGSWDDALKAGLTSWGTAGIGEIVSSTEALNSFATTFSEATNIPLDIAKDALSSVATGVATGNTDIESLAINAVTAVGMNYFNGKYSGEAESFAGDGVESKTGLTQEQIEAARASGALPKEVNPDQIQTMYDQGLIDYDTYANSMYNNTEVQRLYEAATGEYLDPQSIFSTDWNKVYNQVVANNDPNVTVVGSAEELQSKQLQVGKTVIMDGDAYIYDGMDANGSMLLRPADAMSYNEWYYGVNTPQGYQTLLDANGNRVDGVYVKDGKVVADPYLNNQLSQGSQLLLEEYVPAMQDKLNSGELKVGTEVDFSNEDQMVKLGVGDTTFLDRLESSGILDPVDQPVKNIAPEDFVDTTIPEYSLPEFEVDITAPEFTPVIPMPTFPDKIEPIDIPKTDTATDGGGGSSGAIVIPSGSSGGSSGGPSGGGSPVVGGTSGTSGTEGGGSEGTTNTSGTVGTVTDNGGIITAPTGTGGSGTTGGTTGGVQTGSGSGTTTGTEGTGGTGSTGTTTGSTGTGGTATGVGSGWQQTGQNQWTNTETGEVYEYEDLGSYDLGYDSGFGSGYNQGASENPWSQTGDNQWTNTQTGEVLNFEAEGSYDTGYGQGYDIGQEEGYGSGYGEGYGEGYGSGRGSGFEAGMQTKKASEYIPSTPFDPFKFLGHRSKLLDPNWAGPQLNQREKPRAKTITESLFGDFYK